VGSGQRPSTAGVPCCLFFFAPLSFSLSFNCSCETGGGPNKVKVTGMTNALFCVITPQWVPEVVASSNELLAQEEGVIFCELFLCLSLGQLTW